MMQIGGDSSSDTSAALRESLLEAGHENEVRNGLEGKEEAKEAKEEEEEEEEEEVKEQEQKKPSRAQDGTKKSKRKRAMKKKWMRIRKLQKDSPPPIDITFQIMQNRKVMRQIWGTYENNRPWTMLWVFLTLLLLFGAITASFHGVSVKVSNSLGFWSLVTLVVFLILVYTLTRILVVFRWMLYWLLSAEVLNFLLYQEYNLFSSNTPLWLLILLGVVEGLTLWVYIFIHFINPRLLASEWFRKRIGPENWWEVRMIGPWSLTYANGFFERNTCTYRGETNSQGLPHGYGHWMDDSYHGEILTGWWENGKPVGPFHSREYGSGYAFESVMIGFVMATDDDFSTYKYIPTNDKPPRCGVASVECSASGSFFSHLPEATLLYGPYELETIASDHHLVGGTVSSLNSEVSGATFHTPSSTVVRHESSHEFDSHPPIVNGRQTSSIASCLSRLRYLSASNPLSTLVITTMQGRGVSVAGHIYTKNGKCSSRRCQQLTIDIVYPDEMDSNRDHPNIAKDRGADFEDDVGVDVDRDGNDNTKNNRYRTSNMLSNDEDYSLDSSSMRNDNESSLLLSSTGDDMESTRISTPSLRSSVRFAGSTTQDEEEEEEEEEEEGEDENDDDDDIGHAIINFQNNDNEVENYRQNENMSTSETSTIRQNKPLRQQTHLSTDSDVESIDYDSNKFGLDDFELNASGAAKMTSNVSYTSLRNQDRQKLLFQDTSSDKDTYNQLNQKASFSKAYSNITPHLRVRDWKSAMDGHTEALIFVPGFNSSLKNSLERFGQFLVIGGAFPQYIKPFIFVWPAGRVATYLSAVDMAADVGTARAFGKMLDGLIEAGIRDVHIMTHSMGVQALLGAFRDTPDGERGSVSLRFSLAPDFASDNAEMASNGSVWAADDLEGTSPTQSSSAGLLRCRTITLLNPDYPLAAFVDHGFETIRRVCDVITIVGNAKDQALYWSEMGNGAMNTLHHFFGGNSYPDHLRVNTPLSETVSEPRDPDSCCPSWCTCCCSKRDGSIAQGTDRLFSKQLTVGKSIFQLYAPPLSRAYTSSSPYLHLGAPRGILERMRRDGKRRQSRKRTKKQVAWLDLDVIDSTSLDSNVHPLAHNYFNLNGVLRNDLHELIITCRRASDRSTLLHREGNIYSYASAPSYVVNTG